MSAMAEIKREAEFSWIEGNKAVDQVPGLLVFTDSQGQEGDFGVGAFGPPDDPFSQDGFEGLYRNPGTSPVKKLVSARRDRAETVVRVDLQGFL
jgi:hypothetical protein